MIPKPKPVTDVELREKFDSMMRYFDNMPVGSAKRVLKIHFLIRALTLRATEEVLGMMEAQCDRDLKALEGGK